jgi:hypothetical protein
VRQLDLDRSAADPAIDDHELAELTRIDEMVVGLATPGAGELELVAGLDQDSPR